MTTETTASFYDEVMDVMERIEAARASPAPPVPATDAAPPSPQWFSCRACDYDACAACAASTPPATLHPWHALAPNAHGLPGRTCDGCGARDPGPAPGPPRAASDGRRIRVRACDVASLCGFGFEAQDKAFFSLLSRQEPWATVVRDMGRTLSRAPPEAVLEAAGVTRAVVARAAAIAATASGGKGVRAAVEGAVAAAAPAIAAAADGDAAVTAALQAALARGVVMGRGALLEQAGLDRAEVEVGAPVEARNDRLYEMVIAQGRVKLVGKIDGLVRGGSGGGCAGGGGGAPAVAPASAPYVHEEKTRTRELAHAPPNTYFSDVVQVRCYMALLRANGEPVDRAVVREAFACGRSRSTVVFHDDAQWRLIEAELLRVADRLRDISYREVEALVYGYLMRVQ